MTSTALPPVSERDTGEAPPPAAPADTRSRTSVRADQDLVGAEPRRRRGLLPRGAPVTASKLGHAPLSWQQESLVLKPSSSGAGEIHLDFPIPDDVTDTEFERRCQELVSREAALHT